MYTVKFTFQKDEKMIGLHATSVGRYIYIVIGKQKQTSVIRFRQGSLKMNHKKFWTFFSFSRKVRSIRTLGRVSFQYEMLYLGWHWINKNTWFKMAAKMVMNASCSRAWGENEFNWLVQKGNLPEHEYCFHFLNPAALTFQGLSSCLPERRSS